MTIRERLQQMIFATFTGIDFIQARVATIDGHNITQVADSWPAVEIEMQRVGLIVMH